MRIYVSRGNIERPEFPKYCSLQVSFVLGTGQKYECWMEFLDSQDENQKPAFTRVMVNALLIAVFPPRHCWHSALHNSRVVGV